MSCEAAAKEIPSASANIVTMEGEASAAAARPSPPRARASWQITIQPRRRPSSGGTKRSISGDQRNFSVQGSCVSVSSPTQRRSVPEERSQSGSAIQIRPRGRPDAKDSAAMDAILSVERFTCAL